VKVQVRAWAVAVGAACATAVAPFRTLTAQVGATVDVGITNVRYDGFLPSAAASISPMFGIQQPRLFVLARGTLLRFESGRQSLQGGASASFFPARFGQWRVELTGNAGASRYADFASFSHLLAGPRLHVAGERQGLWIGGTLGTTSFGGEQRSVTTFASGAWAERFGATWLLNANSTRVGDTSYVDVEGAVHYEFGRVTLDGSLGARSRSQGGGHGVYGEASGAYGLGAWISLVLAGGRYPTDPTRGSVSGRYLGLGLRFNPLPRRTAVARSARRYGVSGFGSGDSVDPPAVTAELQPCDCDGGTLVIVAVGVSVIEVSGDFTDWEPVVLARGDRPGTWRVPTPLAPGTYRFNVRLDGREWIVPAGVTRLQDEFEGEVGLLVVP
jgi:hypothetical protein